MPHPRFPFPTGENLKRAAGQRTRDERRGCLVVRINHSIVVSPVFHQRLQVAEAGITGGIIMPAAALVARDIGRSGHGVIGLNIGPEERIPLPEPAGRSGGGHVTKYSNVLLRNRISRNRNLRVCNDRTRGLTALLRSLAHRSGIAAAQDRYHGSCCKQQAQHSSTGQHGHLLSYLFLSACRMKTQSRSQKCSTIDIYTSTNIIYASSVIRRCAIYHTVRICIGSSLNFLCNRVRSRTTHYGLISVTVCFELHSQCSMVNLCLCERLAFAPGYIRIVEL